MLLNFAADWKQTILALNLKPDKMRCVQNRPAKLTPYLAIAQSHV